MAEALLQDKIRKHNLEHLLEADSAGTADYHIGEGPDRRTLTNAAKHQIRISHQGRQLQTEDFESFDMLLVMDHSNLKNSLQLAMTETHRNKIQLLRNFDLEENGEEVPDPWFGGEEGFEEVFNILDRCTDSLLHYLKNNL